MKIAICFSGAIRSFKSCYPSIYRSLIEPLNADVFMHLWTFGEDIAQHKNEHRYITHFKLQDDECSIDYVIDKIKPKKYTIDEYNYEWEKEIVSGCNGYDIIRYMDDHDTNYAVSSMGMYFKIFKANELKCQYEDENNFKYDIVIRCRLDFKWSDNFTIGDFSNITDNELLIIKDSYCTTAHWAGNDKFFAGTSTTMNKMCNLYNEIGHYHKNEICQIEGQNLNKYHIKKLNLQLKYLGDKDTYYKCTHKGRINTRQIKCFVHNSYSFTGYYICDKLMDRGYIVHGDGLVDTKVRNMNKLSLQTFSSFEHIDEIQNIEQYKCVIVADDFNKFGKIKHSNITYIIDTNANNIEDSLEIYDNSKSCHKMFMLYNLYGCRSDVNNNFYQSYSEGKSIDGRMCYIKDSIEYMIDIILKNKNYKRVLMGELIPKELIKFDIDIVEKKVDVISDQIDILKSHDKKNIHNTLKWFEKIKSIELLSS